MREAWSSKSNPWWLSRPLYLICPSHFRSAFAHASPVLAISLIFLPPIPLVNDPRTRKQAKIKQLQIRRKKPTTCPCCRAFIAVFALHILEELVEQVDPKEASIARCFLFGISPLSPYADIPYASPLGLAAALQRTVCSLSL